MPFMAECHEEFWEGKRKIGQHSAMDGMLLFVHMPFMAEYHEKFWKGKRKIGQHSAMDGTHLICPHAIHGRVP